MTLRSFPKLVAATAAAAFLPSLRASESDIHIPDLRSVSFFNGALSGNAVLMIGLVVCVLGIVYGWRQ